MSSSPATGSKIKELSAGAFAILPIVIAAFPIGLLFGALAAGKGLSPLEVGLMSGMVFAGGAQFVALDIWQSPISISALTFSALLVNLRHMLMSASLGPKLTHFSPTQKILGFFFLTDEAWALAEHRALKCALTPLWCAGVALPLYFSWVISSALGAAIGSSLGDPGRFGLDFAFTAVFIALVMGFWKGPRTGAILAASGGAAVLTHMFIPGAWYIAAGALAGVFVAAYQAGDTSNPQGETI